MATLKGRDAREFFYDLNIEKILSILEIVRENIKSEYIYSEMYPDEIIGVDDCLDDKTISTRLTSDQVRLVADVANVDFTSLARDWYKSSLFWQDRYFSFSKWDIDDLIEKLKKGSSGATRIILTRGSVQLVAAIINKNWKWES